MESSVYRCVAGHFGQPGPSSRGRQ